MFENRVQMLTNVYKYLQICHFKVTLIIAKVYHTNLIANIQMFILPMYLSPEFFATFQIILVGW